MGVYYLLMEEYIRRVKKNKDDKEAWNYIYLEYRQLIKLIVDKYIFNINDRQDVQQEIWIKLYKYIQNYDLTRDFKSWLFILGKRICIDWLNKNRRNNSNENKNIENYYIISEVMFNDEYVENNDFTEYVILKETLEKLLSEVKEKEQVLAFKLLFLDCMTIKDIAILLGRPVNTVRNWPYRVREKIKLGLKENYEKNTCGRW